MKSKQECFTLTLYNRKQWKPYSCKAQQRRKQHEANPLIGLTCLLDVLTDLLACLRIKVASLPQAPKVPT